jgi:hypothetical protein
MRTSGSGSDLLMTAAPLAMLVVFVVYMAGGPAASMSWLESTLEAGIGWVGKLLH